MGASPFCEVASGPDIRTAYRDAHSRSAAQSGGSYSGNLGTKSGGYVDFGRVPPKWNVAQTCRAVEELVNYVEFGDGDEWHDVGEHRAIVNILVRLQHQRVETDAAGLVKCLGDQAAARLVATYLDKWGPTVVLQVDTNTWALCGLASS